MLEKGDKVGDYELVRFLGRGQFGEVWLAEKEIRFSNRKFQHALKFLFNHGDEINLRSVQAEIDTWIEASGHPNVMSVLDMLVHRDHVVIASEFAEGGSIKDWLKRSDGKARTTGDGLQMMLGILKGIEHLHAKQIVHRDLKPDNILLQSDYPRIADFGISRIVSAGSLSTIAMGSPFYMSPESFEGSKSTQTDIWSAGVILYEIVSGEVPYQADSLLGLVSAIQKNEPKPLPAEVPSGLRNIVATALDKRIENRFASACEFRWAIQNEITGTNAASKPAQPQQTETPFDTSPSPDPAIAQLETEKVLQSAVPTVAFKLEETGESASQSQDLGRAESQSLPTAEAFIPTPRQKSRLSSSIILAPAVVAAIAAAAIIIYFLLPSAEGGAPAVGVTSGNKITNEKVAPPAPDGMAYVPGGEFMMGRNDGNPDERPAHTVKVAPFYMDIYEVTNGDYQKFLAAHPERPPPQGWKNRTYPTGQDRLPVVGVTWQDANTYASWLNKRLPTEEEWEFAARGTAGLLFPWGNNWNPANANVGTRGFKDVGSHPGGRSPFGMYDMIGNAWEWTASDFRTYRGEAKIDEKARREDLKTIRGGSYEANEESRTAIYRVGWKADGATTYSQTGFRCASDIKQ